MSCIISEWPRMCPAGRQTLLYSICLSIYRSGQIAQKLVVELCLGAIYVTTLTSAAHVLHWIKSQSFQKDFNSYYLLISVTPCFRQSTETYYQLTYSPCNKRTTCTKSTYVYNLGPTTIYGSPTLSDPTRLTIASVIITRSPWSRQSVK